MAKMATNGNEMAKNITSKKQDDGDLGNKQKSPPETIRDCKYRDYKFVMTWNNYPDDVMAKMVKKLVPECQKYVFGKEVGASGTPHIQGAFIMKNKQRITVGKLWKLLECDGINIDGMKGSWEQQKYCTKDGEYICDDESKLEWVKQPYRKPMKILKYEQLNPWELKIDNIVRNEIPDDRSIYWFYSRNGNMGKTTFCKYLNKTYGGCVIGGKASDSKNNIVNYIENSSDKRAPQLVICPIPKSYSMEYVSYEGIEMIKDMFFYSGKYEGGQVNDDCPHVFVFANEPPDYSQMMKDRWNVYEILDKEGNYISQEEKNKKAKEEREEEDKKLLADLQSTTS